MANKPIMYIKKIKIENFKCFKAFSLDLNDGVNILVGNNEAGKTTILEALHLALTGFINGKYLKNELTQYLFNNVAILEYLNSLKPEQTALPLPYILIEVFISGDDLPIFEGDGNSEKKNECCISFKIAFDEDKKDEYQEFISHGNINTLPIEYYDISWTSCARNSITSRSIPIKSALIDSSNNRFQNGSDVYISRIIKDLLTPKEIINVSQAHRKMKETFTENNSIIDINKKIKLNSKISNKDVKLSVDLSSRNAWETSLLTYLDDIPFHNVGKGEQCIIKTKLALSHNKAKEANLLLLEEPENHLSYSKLNELIKEISDHSNGKQIVISTHSSFVANKLGLENLILLNNSQTVRFKDLDSETNNFFKKISGYDTLRLILSKKVILVEGDSDELIIQKAYMLKNNNRLPIEDGIDIISVGTSFLNFLELAEKIEKPVAVTTDSDGDIEALKEKYTNYIGENTKSYIKICFDNDIDSGDLTIGKNKKPFNYNTLEPKFLKANSIEKLNTILGQTYTNIDDMHKFMRNNKTECALKIFESNEEMNFPRYILDSIS